MNKMLKQYAVEKVLAEYERAISELLQMIELISDSGRAEIVYKKTSDLGDIFQYKDFLPFKPPKKIKNRPRQIYDIERLIKYAIIGVRQHRRQVEKIKTILREREVSEKLPGAKNRI